MPENSDIAPMDAPRLRDEVRLSVTSISHGSCLSRRAMIAVAVSYGR
jgi:hypothetical protein